MECQIKEDIIPHTQRENPTWYGHLSPTFLPSRLINAPCQLINQAAVYVEGRLGLCQYVLVGSGVVFTSNHPSPPTAHIRAF